MKTLNQFIGILAFAAVTLFTASCESLDQAPEDFFAAGNFWKDKDQVSGYMVSMHSYLRSTYSNHFYFGEIRNGLLGDGDDHSGTSVFGEALADQPYVFQRFDEENAYVSNWNGMYSYIVRTNHAIIEMEATEHIDDNSKAYFLGQLYGMRAYYYLTLYQAYGGVPLVTDFAINEGEPSASRLSRPRANPSEIMALLKDDINKSEENFKKYDGKVWEDQYTWSLYATLMLKAQIYTWAAQVTTGDQQATGTSDLNVAKSALLEVVNSGRFKLMPEFYQAFRPDYKNSNSEIIFAVAYNVADGTYFPNSNNCLAANALIASAYDLNGTALARQVGTDKEPYGKKILIDGIMRYQYKETFWRSFSEDDTRRDATFFPVKTNRNAEATGTNFGVIMTKFAGTYYDDLGAHYRDCDGPVFRYAEALLLLAEIENNLGNDPSGYINQIRERAYGDKIADHKYANQSRYENSKAILDEYTKEFVFEGKRWYAMQRLKDASGKALVFDASVNYPFVLGEAQTPLLTDAEAYKVLWPISVSTNTNDRAITQTPGYESKF